MIAPTRRSQSRKLLETTHRRAGDRAWLQTRQGRGGLRARSGDRRSPTAPAVGQRLVICRERSGRLAGQAEHRACPRSAVSSADLGQNRALASLARQAALAPSAGPLPRRPSGDANSAGRRLRQEPVDGGWRCAGMQHRALRRSAARHPSTARLSRPLPVRQNQPVLEPDRRQGFEAHGRERGVGVAAEQRQAARQAHLNRTAQVEAVITELEKQREGLRAANDGDGP